MLPFYVVATAAMKTAMVSLTRWQVIGRENVPRQGPLIVVSNHLSLADPPLLSASIPRRITFMAKEELFHSWGGIVVRAFGAFPVQRRAVDRKALRAASGVLESGQVLGMFPEGQRSLQGGLQRAELGAALIALRSKVPILPVGISGTENVMGPAVAWRRPRVVVSIGEPFQVGEAGEQPTRDDLQLATRLIMSHIARVLPAEYRGMYAEEASDGD